METSIFIERLFVCSFAFIFTYASQFLNRTSTYLYGLRSTGIHYTTAPLQVLIGGHWKKNSNVSKPLEFFCNYVWLPFFFSVDFQCICAPPVTLYERISKCNNQKRSALFLELRNEKALIAVGGLEIGVHTYDFVLHHNVTHSLEEIRENEFPIYYFQSKIPRNRRWCRCRWMKKGGFLKHVSISRRAQQS